MEKFNLEDSIVKEYDSVLMKRLLKFVRPYIKEMALVFLLMFIAVFLDLSRPYLIKNAIDQYINGYKSYYTLKDNKILKGIHLNGKTVSMVYDGKNYFLAYGRVDYSKSFIIKDKLYQDNNSFEIKKITYADLKNIRQDDLNGIIKTALYVFLVSLTLFFVNYGQVYILNLTSQKIVFNIREKLFKHIEELSLSFFDKTPIGRLVTRVTNDVEAINEMYTSVLVYLIKDFFLLAGIIIAMFTLNTKLALVMLFFIPIIILLTIIFRKYDREAYRNVRTKLAKINAFLSENISGMKTIQIFNIEDKTFDEFEKINKDYYKETRNQIIIFGIFRPSIDFLSTMTLAAIVWFGGKMVLNEMLPFGVLYVFVSYVQQFFQPIYDITEKYDILQSAMASAERIFSLLDTNEKIPNSKDAVIVDKLKGEIEFKNVWFAYKNGEYVLKDVSFKIKPGEKIAIVGHTGAGKTSIINLISRLYDIQKGEILVDGINIKDYDKYSLRRNIATVMQDVFLFTGDIKGNIRLGENRITDKKIMEVCKFVNADNFIEKLPRKYDSPVNERGTTLSQGQRQLIAFARALAFDPSILVLDEATSNIDTETEGLIQDALKKISEGRTTIIVAHRLSTKKNCDRIIVMHKGRVREIGTHDELMEKKGLYYNLYQLQFTE
ncbi:MAG: ABC transporter ATP-binding protein/permease [Caloramator sp.]|nr:ABC transporter ATP-binding protein/permease [Caloramator sp.]